MEHLGMQEIRSQVDNPKQDQALTNQVVQEEVEQIQIQVLVLLAVQEQAQDLVAQVEMLHQEQVQDLVAQVETLLLVVQRDRQGHQEVQLQDLHLDH